MSSHRASRSVSIVINTDNRADSLGLTLAGLEQLEYPNFEVVVVNGPTDDGTDEVVAAYAGRIKLLSCERRNLSESRNIGIKAASGELVAFIDDDAYPDPLWLQELVGAFDDDDVAAAGGPVWDYTGARFQAKFSQASVFGTAWIGDGTRAQPDTDVANTFQFPGSVNFTYPIGTNVLFRRDRLVEIGGFDEEFEYYLDETDVCRRLLDRGYRVAALDRGYIFHKFLASDIREPNRAIKERYAVLKNTAYFALKHALQPQGYAAVCSKMAEFIQQQTEDFTAGVSRNELTHADFAKFQEDIPRGFNDAWVRFHEGIDKTRPADWFVPDEEFLPFETGLPEHRLNLCLLIQDYPPRVVHGIARITHVLATGLAARGHVVHVITRGADHDRVDLEDGVWVHRVVPRQHKSPDIDVTVPKHVWDYSATLLAEVDRIDGMRPVDLVFAPNWDSEGLALMLDGRWPVVTGLYTPVGTVATMDPGMIASVRNGEDLIPQLIATDTFVCSEGTHFLASTEAIIREIERVYTISLQDKHVGYVPLAIEDIAAATPPADAPTPWRDVVFVGRLEGRKGIDVLLDVAPSICRRFPDVRFRIVGDDSGRDASGRSYRTEFESDPMAADVRDQVVFDGPLDDDELYAVYRDAACVVVPSRFESFGLIILEGAAFAVPAVASAVGGMVSLIDDGVTGVLVEPANANALAAGLEGLLADDDRRVAMGQAARRRYDEHYRGDRMVDGMLTFFEDVLTPSQATVAPEPFDGDATGEPVRFEDTELAAMLRCPDCQSVLTPHITTQLVTGGVKTGQMSCSACARVVADVSQGRFNWIDPRTDTEPVPAEPLVVGVLGEKRIDPRNAPGMRTSGAWNPTAGHMMTEGKAQDQVTYVGTFTDATVRLLKWPFGGIVELLVDGVVTAEFDGFMEAGSQNAPTVVASDLPLTQHEITVRATGKADSASQGTGIAIEEIVFGGPVGAGFDPVGPLNRGNPFPAHVDRYLAAVPADGWVLEVGGGDRRVGNPRHINLEYMDFEFAGMRGDIERLPFADDSFDFVFTQAVFEHVRDPFLAARELLRVTKPGQLVLTDVAFLQPLHAVPYHYFNMTLWGVHELFAGCEVVESDWFGGLGPTLQWLFETTGVEKKVGPDRLRKIIEDVTSIDSVISHDELKPVASGVYTVVRKPV